MSLKPKIHITIVSDVICPWCWVGKRKLEMAMEKVKVGFSLIVEYLLYNLSLLYFILHVILFKTKYDFEVKWEPFLLASNIPLEGKQKTSPQHERY